MYNYYNDISRYDIVYVKLPKHDSSHIQNGCRPAIVVSNDVANLYSPVITIIPLTSRLTKKALPTHVRVKGYGLEKESVALCEQLTTIDKFNVVRKVGKLNRSADRDALRRAMFVQLGFAA